jgi:CNP1-like family
MVLSRVVSADEETGWTGVPFIEPPAWKEEVPGLPAFPHNDRLLELPASLPGYDFHVFIDPDSLSVGGDRVVRYTLVIVSSSGVRNISYEGLHCGKHEYRRYAYGSGDTWFPIEAAPWQRVSDTGMEHYRHVLYWDYLCNPLRPNLDAAAMISRIRNPSGPVSHE